MTQSTVAERFRYSTMILIAATLIPAASPAATAPDPHSRGNSHEVVGKHLDLDLQVDFERQLLTGSATWTLERVAPAGTQAKKFILDTRGLDIRKVTLDSGTQPVKFVVGPADPLQGSALEIPISSKTRQVRIEYATRPDAAALQWLSPQQTAGGKRPFLFTQSQSILARTWIPCQDSPGVRFSYTAKVQVPPDLLALMSAENPVTKAADGSYRFRMAQPVPSYLMALSVGDIAFRSLGTRSGVYAEPSVVEMAAAEFVDTEKMISAAEKLYGPYRWGRYDLLVLPPSFPFGGMENPRLTFATPTILAGDRSLVSLVAHELAHSWSGNLVTNATWNDFWLNEGFTVYFEERIIEAVYGKELAAMEASLELAGLRETVARMGADNPDTRLAVDFTGRDPDEGVGDIAYQKGRFFLRAIEQAVGRERFDVFLRDYFDRFAFQTMTTPTFIAFLRSNLLDASPQGKNFDVDGWVYKPGLPPIEVAPTDAFAKVDRELERLAAGSAPADLATQGWVTQQWMRFVRALPETATAADLAGLDAAFHLTASGNAEIATAWFLRAIAANYEPAYPKLEQFLQRVGRRKFLLPLYTALAKTPAGKTWAGRVYGTARPGYHSVSRNSIDDVLGIPKT